MTDEPTTKSKDTSTRDMAVRTQALDWAIRANCGLCYDTNDKVVYDPEEILKAAKLFEIFIKTTKPTNELKSQSELKQKDGW